MRPLISVVAAITCLTACVSFIPEPEAAQALYRLGPVSVEQKSAPLKHSVIVREPEASRVLAGMEMVARDRRGAIRLIDGVEWADRSTKLFQHTVLDYLSHGEEGIALLPETGARAEFELTWRISEFALEQNTAVAQVEMTLLDGNTRAPLRQARFSSQVDASGSSAERRAEALVEAGRDVIADIAAFVVSVTDEISEARAD